MEEQNTNKKNLPPKFTLTVRILVGAYLWYISYGLYGNLGGHTGNKKIIFMFFMIAFAVIGAVLIGISGYAYVRGAYAGGKLDDQVDEPQQEKQTEASEEEAVVVVVNKEEQEQE